MLHSVRPVTLRLPGKDNNTRTFILVQEHCGSYCWQQSIGNGSLYRFVSFMSSKGPRDQGTYTWALHFLQSVVVLII